MMEPRKEAFVEPELVKHEEKLADLTGVGSGNFDDTFPDGSG
jgi:hypothetical protein